MQNAYSILNRTDDDVLDLCRDDGIAFVPYFPLGSAFGTGGPKHLAADPHVSAVADKHGPPRRRSRWPGSSPATSGRC